MVKDFGAEGRGLLSFPKPGTTASIDMPLRGAATQALVDGLNRCVIDAGGRIYLAKDAFTTAQHFAAMEKRLPAFLDVRRAIDPASKISSSLAERLFPAR